MTPSALADVGTATVSLLLLSFMSLHAAWPPGALSRILVTLGCCFSLVKTYYEKPPKPAGRTEILFCDARKICYM